MWKHYSDTAKFPRKWAAALWLFVFSFFIKQKLRFTLRAVCAHFKNEKCRPYPVIEGPGVFIAWWGSSTWHCPSLHIRVAQWRGSMFSHTLGRRTLKCYLMLAGVHVDTAGFLGVPQKVCTIILPFTAVLWWCTAAVILVWNVPFYFWVSPLSGLWATTATGPLMTFTTKPDDWV